MRKNGFRLFCLVMAAALSLGMLAGVLPEIVQAATAPSTTYGLGTLLTQGKIKALGRTQVSKVDATAITADWSGNGFFINVDSNGSEFVVGCESYLDTNYAAIFVDEEQVWRGLVPQNGVLSTTIPAGKHTVSVFRENGLNSNAAAYLRFTTLSFDGKIEEPPANKELYIEVIGDSIVCGSGSAALYAPGISWSDADHSVQGSFAWHLSKSLDADLSVVARGGSGLMSDATSAEGEKTNSMLDIYPYASGHNKTEGEYNPTTIENLRVPDLVIIKLGVNDSLKYSNTARQASWNKKLGQMIQLVRNNYGEDVKILLAERNIAAYSEMLKYADADDNIWSCLYTHSSNGTNALASQEYCHATAEDEREIAEYIEKAIIDNNILSIPTEAAPTTYTDLTYYVSETGSDDNNGKTAATPKRTLTNLLEQINTDCGGADAYAAGQRVVIYVTGTVDLKTGQKFGGFSPTANGVPVPVLITTNDYDAATDNKATVNAFSSSTDTSTARIVYLGTDWIFQNIKLHAPYDESGSEYLTNLYADGYNLVLDNCSLTSAQDNWIVSADSFTSSGKLKADLTADVHGSVTFRNGDYTNLNWVAVINQDTIDNEITSVPHFHGSIIIDEGAQMDTVYGLYGTLAVGSATVEFKGGTVENYIPTKSGTSSAKIAYAADVNTVFSGGTLNCGAFYGTGNYINLTGNVTNTFKKGQFVGTVFAGLGQNVTLAGDVTNNIQGGEIRITPAYVEGYQGFFMGGFGSAAITGNVTNNISGGDLLLLFDEAAEYTKPADAGIYMGIRGGSITGNLTNNISGGNLGVIQRVADDNVTSASIYLGNTSGSISGTLANNITKGSIVTDQSEGIVSFGHRTTNNYTGKIVNTIGVKDSLQGPQIYSSASISLAGANIPLGAKYIKGEPDVDTYCTDTVVQQNTIYSGAFVAPDGVYASATGTLSLANNRYNYVLGSVQTDIYGGKFIGTFYGTGGSPIYGHVTTNIYDGYFGSIYGSASSVVYDGVELNIYGLIEYINLSSNPDYRIYAAGKTSKISARTANRAAVALNVEPTQGKELVLRMPIYSGHSNETGTVQGDTAISIRGGVYPNGLAVDGKTIGEVLAGGCSTYNYITGDAISYADTDTRVDGYVEVLGEGDTTSRELVYYVHEEGKSSNDGLHYITPKKTIRDAFAQAVADNGGSTVFPNGSKLTIYVRGAVKDNSGQSIMYGAHLTTEDGGHLETVITTYGYEDANTRATIIHSYTPSDNNDSSSPIRTDLTLRNVDLLVRDNSHTTKLYANGSTLILDGVQLRTDNSAPWIVSADSFTYKAADGINPSGDTPVYGTVIFKNGNYTNLDYVTTVNRDSIVNLSGASFPNLHCKVIVGEGAVMDTVYGPMTKLAAGSSTIEVKGGSVNTIYGTGDGDALAVGTDTTISVSGGTVNALYGTGCGSHNSDKNTNGGVTVNGDVSITVSGGMVNQYYGTGYCTDATVIVDSKDTTLYGAVSVTGTVSNTITGGTVNNFSGTGFGLAGSKLAVGAVENTISGGTFGGHYFLGAGDYVTVSGDVRNTISGGTMSIVPEDTNKMDAYFFAGRKNISAANVENTISGGQFNIFFDNNVDSCYYLGGGSGSSISGNATNKLTGGTFYVEDRDGAGSAAVLFMGPYSGHIYGTLRNEISAITLDGTKTKKDVYLTCGARATKGVIGKIENIIGDPLTGAGPILAEGNLNLVGSYGQIGVSKVITGALPDTSTTATATETTVITNTIYGGTFPNNVYATPTNTVSNNKNIVYGSVTTDIYGGDFNTFYGHGDTPVYGHITTNIHGGTFNAIYGARSGKVYDGVELNIYGMTEGSAPAGIYTAGTSGTTNLSVTTAGRAVAAMNIAPTDSLVLSMPVSVGRKDGNIPSNVSVSISGGTYTSGLNVGVPVNSAIAEGYVVAKTAGNVLLELPDDELTTGTESVSVIAQLQVSEDLKFSAASVSLHNDLGVNFKVGNTLLTTGGYTDPYVVFVFNGQTTTQETYVVDGNGRAVFRFRDIAPHMVGDTITATLYATKDGVPYAGEPATYSVEQYCYNMLGTYNEVDHPAYGTLRTLLVDLLNYCSAAQQYVPYKTDSLANAKLLDKQKAWGTQTDPTAESILNLQYATVENPSVTWVSGGLRLEDSVTVRYTLAASSLEGLTVKIESAGKEYTVDGSELVATGTEGQYYLYFDKLNAAQMREPILATVYVDGTAVSNTVRYSIESYVAADDGSNAVLTALVKAMLRYGDSAAAYVK